MKIAIPVADGRLCPHFGHCQQFALIDVDETTRQTAPTAFLTPPPHEPGVLPRWLHQQGADVIIAGGMGNGLSSCSQRTASGSSSVRVRRRRRTSSRRI